MMEAMKAGTPLPGIKQIDQAVSTKPVPLPRNKSALASKPKVFGGRVM